jgi:hypothetical protein
VLVYWADIETCNLLVEGYNLLLYLHSKFRNNTNCAVLSDCVSNFKGVLDIKP